jgi:hypothetical protein
MSDDIWAEVARLVAEHDAQRPKIIKEYRLYYNSDGTIIGLWESGHPTGDNYIVLDDPGMFYSANTLLLRVQNKKLILLDPRVPTRTRLKKSTTGFPVVQNNAALILESNETYPEIEYYDRTIN